MSASPLAKVHDFDATDLPVRQRFDAWHASFDYFYDTNRAADPDHQANWRHTAWGIDDLLVAKHDLGPFVGHRGPEQLRHDAKYDVLVRYVREGSQHGLHSGIPVLMKAGGIYVYRADREFSTLVKNHVRTFAVGVAIDRRTICPDCLPALMCLEPQDATTRILANVMERMEATLHDPEPRLSEQLNRQFRAVLLQVLDPDRCQGHGRKAAISARRTAMKDFIDRNMDKPGFDLNHLLSAFGASRATVFRDFAEDGGLQQYVTTRRLERAFDDLARTQPRRGGVQQVAELQGFSDTGHFSRLFRQRFGITPSDAMMIGRLAAE